MTCDHCNEQMRVEGGWYVGKDHTSDCSKSPRGHEVDGSPRP